MSIKNLRSILESLLESSKHLYRIPSTGKVFFIEIAAKSKEHLKKEGSYSKHYLNFANKIFFNCDFDACPPLPALPTYLIQFRHELLPFLIRLENKSVRVFEDLLSLQKLWFESWKKFKQRVFIVYFDMIGFSEKAERRNLNAVIPILAYRNVIFDYITKGKGHPEASGGDAAIAIFKDGEKALDSSLKILNLLNRLQIGARIGISYGDFLSQENGRPILGNSIATAVRIAEGGSKKKFPKYFTLKEDELKEKRPYYRKDSLSGIWISWNAINKITGNTGSPNLNNPQPFHSVINNLLKENNNKNIFLVQAEKLKGVADGSTEIDRKKYTFFFSII